MDDLTEILQPLRKIILTGNSLEPRKKGFGSGPRDVYISCEGIKPVAKHDDYAFLLTSVIEFMKSNKFSIDKEKNEAPEQNSVGSISHSRASLIVEDWEQTAAKDLITLINEGKSQQVLDSLVAASKLSKVCQQGIVFCLVVLLRKASDKNIITSCYSSVPLICKTSQLFLLFIQLNKIYLLAQKKNSGFGGGMKRAIRSWYLRWEPGLLAIEVSRYPAAFGWSHKDVLKLAHIKVKELPNATAVVLHCIFSGFVATKEKFANDESVKEIMELLQVLHLGASEISNSDAVIERGRKILSKFGSLSLKDFPTQVLNNTKVLTFLLQSGSEQIIIEALRSPNLCRHFLSDADLRNGLKNEMKKDSFANSTDVMLAVMAYNNCRRISAQIIKAENESTKTKPKQWMRNIQSNPIRMMKIRPSVPRPKEIEEIFTVFSQLITKAAQKLPKLEDILICVELSYSINNFISILLEDTVSKEVSGTQVLSLFILSLTSIPYLEATFPLFQKMKKAGLTKGPGAFHWIKNDCGRLARLQSEKVNVEESLKLAINNKVSLCIFVCFEITETFGKDVFDKLNQLKANKQKLRVVVCGLNSYQSPFDIRPFSNPDLVFLFGFNQCTIPTIHAFAKGFL